MHQITMAERGAAPLLNAASPLPLTELGDAHEREELFTLQG